MDLPQRKKNRLEKHLYNSGYFFVTICTQDRSSYFREPIVGANTIRPQNYGILSKIIKGFKQITSKQLHQSGLKNFQRQKSFHDHIIRNESDLDRIREYIHNNPYKRKEDEHYL